jgi:hypothetical protein
MKTIEGKWEEIVTRQDLVGHTVRVTVLDEATEDPWLKKFNGWVATADHVNHPIDDSRESMYSRTIDDPR